MATSVIRRYWCDLDDMRLTTSLGDRSPLQELRFKARDSGRIGFQFHRGGIPELLSAGSVLTFGIKEAGDYGGNYLASVTSFTAATTTNSDTFEDTDFYYGALDLNTVAIDTALGASEASLKGISELELDISGASLRFSTDTIPTTIYNDVNQGGEGTPSSADPPYPSASEVQRWKPDITSLTGGTGADLDSLATTTITTPYAVAINNQDTSDVWEVWILTAGTDAENTANGIVRPDDYNGATNAKVWKRKAYYGPLIDGSTLTSGLTFPQNGFDLTDPDGQILTVNAGNITGNSTLTLVSGNYTLTLTANATISGNSTGNLTGTANEISVAANNTLSIPSTFDLSGKSVFKVPVSATPTVSANGTLALDSSVTNFSHGVLRYYGNESLVVVALPEAQISSPANQSVVSYNSANDEFELTSRTTSFYEEKFLSAASSELFPQATSGCAVLATYEAAAGKNYRYLAFDPSTIEYAGFLLDLPNDADTSEGLKVKICWTSPTTAGNVVWYMALYSISDGTALTGTFVDDITVTDASSSYTWLETTSQTFTLASSDKRYMGVIYRTANSGSDTYTGDAWLLGLRFQYKRLGTSTAW